MYDSVSSMSKDIETRRPQLFNKKKRLRLLGTFCVKINTFWQRMHTVYIFVMNKRPQTFVKDIYTYSNYLTCFSYFYWSSKNRLVPMYLMVFNLVCCCFFSSFSQWEKTLSCISWIVQNLQLFRSIYGVTINSTKCFVNRYQLRGELTGSFFFKVLIINCNSYIFTRKNPCDTINNKMSLPSIWILCRTNFYDHDNKKYQTLFKNL